MAEIKIAGVMRASAFSPNHIGADAAIFNMVAEQLRKRGCEVAAYSEEEFIAGAVGENIIMAMCREPRSVELLQQREDAGALVINSGYGIENCGRERLSRILLGSNIPYPETIVANTNESIRATLAKARMNRCWIKRADFGSQHREDVSYVRTPDEGQEVLQEYFLRGITRAVVTRHLEGEVVKFYGVAGQPFFFTNMPFRRDPRIPGSASAPDAPVLDVKALAEMCTRAADLLDVTVYGGDAILGPDGSLHIIDIDDWPSFAPCRNEAAPHIAKAIITAAKASLRK